MKNVFVLSAELLGVCLELRTIAQYISMMYKMGVACVE